MASQPHNPTNAANAQHSTGPHTPEGKARSSQNARKHGLSAQELAVPPEQREEFEEFLDEYQIAICPQGAIQKTLFEELVSAAWNLRRIRRMEAELLTGDPSALNHIARHKSRIERTYHRSLRELKVLQTNDAVAMTLPKFFIDLAAPLASSMQIAKRTQMIASHDESNHVQDERDALRASSRRYRHAAAEAAHAATPPAVP